MYDEVKQDGHDVVRLLLWGNAWKIRGWAMSINTQGGRGNRTGVRGNNGGSKVNPRSANGHLRRKHRARLKAMRCECGICGGRLGPIRYEQPSNAQHPMSFVVDEIRPVSRWQEFGYDSPAAAAQDWNNLQAAHYICNAAKGNKIIVQGSHGAVSGRPAPEGKIKINILDGDW